MTAAPVSENRFKQRARKTPGPRPGGFLALHSEDDQKLSLTPAVNAVLLLSA